ncbi:MAG: stalk domain-containing protein [Paenibacillaceae bacterium]
MKANRLIILTLVFSMIFGATVYADSLWGNYNGYPKAKVFVNDSEVTFKDGEVPAIVIDGSTVLPIRKVAEKLQAIVEWNKDTMTANIYKPNVHMFVSEDVKIDKNKQVAVIKSPFSVVETGKTVDFVVVVQVDGLKAESTGFKISIVKPDGDDYDSKEVLADSSSSSRLPSIFGYTSQPFNVKFSQKGTYLVRFSFKDTDDKYTIISQKSIVSE